MIFFEIILYWVVIFGKNEFLLGYLCFFDFLKFFFVVLILLKFFVNVKDFNFLFF